MPISDLTTASYPQLYSHLEGIAEAISPIVASAKSNPFLTTAGQDEALHAHDKRMGWTADVDAIDAELTARAGRAQKMADDALAEASGRPTGTDGELAAQIRAQRFWGRTRPLLDRLGTARALATAAELVETVDDADLTTVLEELPPYLRMRGIEPGDVLDEALHRRLPVMAQGHRDAVYAGTMHRSVFAPLIGFIRERLASVEAPTVPSRHVFKLGQVEQIDAQQQARTAAAVSRAI